MNVARWRKAAALVLAICVIGVFFAGCTTKVASVKSIEPGTLLVGSESTYPPFEMTVDGKFEGFDIDIANAIAGRLGLKARVVKTRFKEMIPGLKAGHYDVIVSAMTITPARRMDISFSAPYMTADQSICVGLDSSIKTEADLKGKTVGVETGTTGQAEAEEIMKTGGLAKITKFDDILLAFEALEVGSIDAIINDYAVNAYMSAQRGYSRVAAVIGTGENYGIGIGKDNAQMLAGIDKALAAIKADGTYNAIYKKWFSAPK
ncbi:MAG: basic amino acid ABC transporter substrate-binding protein [Candidatus Geothermincolia bacterium]